MLSEQAQLGEARKLSPARPRIRWLPPHGPLGEPIDLEELSLAISCAKPGKAPGPDGISAEMLRLIFRAAPHQCLATMNACLLHGMFPHKWKTAELRLIPKPRKPGQSTTSYRPICLLSVFGKVLERIVKTRLSAHVDPLLSTEQYGFRPGKSTAQAVRAVIDTCLNAKRLGELAVVIALDIRNAFNAARWDKIVGCLTELDTPEYLTEIIKSYFTTRNLRVGGVNIPLSCGVPQGSVLGPLLWNVLYDQVVSLKIVNCKLVAYADDLAVIVQSSNEDILLPKTEAMIWCAPRRLKELSFDVQEHKVTTGNSLKYLGVWLERNGRCYRHAEQSLLKAERRIHSLSRLTRLDGPVRHRTRRMYGQIILSGLLYCVSAWGGLIRTKKEKQKLASASRLALLRICSAPYTVSTEALEVVSGVPPIMLFVRGQVGALPSGELCTEWQRAWQRGQKGQWTRTLIPNIDPWIRRRCGEVDRFVCQFLTGHGVFRAKRWVMGQETDDRCRACGERDTARHAFFECGSFAVERQAVVAELGVFSPETCVAAMCGSLEAWEAVARFAAVVVRRKEDLEERGVSAP